jgi:hypothetical protein
MAQHRYRTATLLGRWFPTRGEACRDALRAGQARLDDSLPDRLCWAVPGEIETESRDRWADRPSSPPPRGLAGAMTPRPSAASARVTAPAARIGDLTDQRAGRPGG